MKQQRLAKQTPLDFIKYIFPHRFGHPFIENWHHGAFNDAMMAVYRGEVKNIIINTPPGSTKTEFFSICFPAWAIGHNPASRFLHLSYADALVEKNSQDCRDMIMMDAFQNIWPRKISEDTKSKKRWNVMDGDKKLGGMYAVATGGQVTGFRAGYMSDGFTGSIIIDDPQKPEDMESQVRRVNSNRLIANTVRSRRATPDTPIVVVMQRLHTDDATGFLLNGGIGEKFEHIKIPALDECGKSYWYYKEPDDQLKAFREAQPSIFSGQYMQEPYIAAGEVYDLDNCARYLRLPEREAVTQVVHSWDTAYKAKTHNDPSVCTVWHVTPSMYYLAEVHRGRWEYPELRRRAFDLANEQKPNAILIEDKASGQSLIQEFKQSSTHPVVPIKPESDKETRARTTATAVVAGKVSLPAAAPWLSEFEQEITAFPKGKHDDQVDSMSQFLRYMQGNNTDSFNDMLDRLYG